MIPDLSCNKDVLWSPWKQGRQRIVGNVWDFTSKLKNVWLPLGSNSTIGRISLCFAYLLCLALSGVEVLGNCFFSGVSLGLRKHGFCYRLAPPRRKQWVGRKIGHTFKDKRHWAIQPRDLSMGDLFTYFSYQEELICIGNQLSRISWLIDHRAL